MPRLMASCAHHHPAITWWSTAEHATVAVVIPTPAIAPSHRPARRPVASAAHEASSPTGVAEPTTSAHHGTPAPGPGRPADRRRDEPNEQHHGAQPGGT